MTSIAGVDPLGASAPLNRYYQPAFPTSGGNYVFSVILTDTEGLESEAVWTASDAALYWEIAGTVAADTVVTNNGAEPGTDQDGNVTPGYYEFSGDDNVYFPAKVAQFDYNEAFTIGVWFKATGISPAAGQYPAVFMQHGSNGCFQYMLIFFKGVLAATVGECGAGQSAIRVPTSANTWYHAVMVYDGSQLEFYINGVSRGTALYRWDACNTPTDFVYLGESEGGGTKFKGTVGDFRVFDRALSREEVIALNNL